MSFNFSFYDDIPASGNNPSDDQPLMLINNVSNEAIWNIDHIGFNTNGSGTHTQITFLNFESPATPAGTAGILYTAAGVGNTSLPDIYFETSNASYHINPIKAWGIATGGVGGAITAQNYNVTSASRLSQGIYQITMPANTLSSYAYGVLISTTSNLKTYGVWIGISVTQFNIQFYDNNGAFQDPSAYLFAVFHI